MRLSPLLFASGLLLACGSRTTLRSGEAASSGGEGGGGGEGGASEPECVEDRDCPPMPADQCGSVRCEEARCVTTPGPSCDDGDPCTTDRCDPRTQACRFTSDRVDRDNDGHFATGNSASPDAALGCGDDCDDFQSAVAPGAPELCDGLDNDCNGAADEGTDLLPPLSAPIALSPASGASTPGGLAFDGEHYFVTYNSVYEDETSGYYRLLDVDGNDVVGETAVPRINADSNAGPVRVTRDGFVTAWQDARQNGGYEIYFTGFSRSGARALNDVRVTNADGFSLSPDLVQTGQDSVVVWSDHRNAASGEPVSLYGQRLDASGVALGGNVQLTSGARADESPSVARLGDRLGIAFTSFAGGAVSLGLLVTEADLTPAAPMTLVDAPNVSSPRTLALRDRFVVTWTEIGDDSTPGTTLNALVFDREGAIVRGPEVLLDGSFIRAHATYSYGDRFVVVWSESSGSHYALFYRSFDEQLEPAPSQGVLASSPESHFVDPVVAPGANGSLAVAFSEQRSGERTHAWLTMLSCAYRTPIPE